MKTPHEAALELLKETHGAKKIEWVAERVAALPVEVPSWGFGRGGTRFAAYESGAEPGTVAQRIAAAGRFLRRTGKGRTVALHFPWDGSTKKDIANLKRWLKKAGVRAGSINSNLFTPRGTLDARLRFGSLTNPVKEVRDASIAHNDECVGIMRELGSNTLVVWLPDGTNSPGQMSLYDQADRVETALGATYRKLRKGERMLIEYKYFEPGMYATAIQDYGRSRSLCHTLGPRARVLVDLGHHAPTTNVEHIVTLLLRSGDLGGFHFNDHHYADDDLATGSLHPGQLFRIMCNLVEGERRGCTPVHDLALMIDQSHNVKDPLEELVESLENIETAYAKALLVDWDALKKAQDAPDPSKADAVLRGAFLTDVRPLLAQARRADGRWATERRPDEGSGVSRDS
jgi:L-rhamnose isomerase/sugar isomerase